MNTNRCLYNSSFQDFIKADGKAILGGLCENYHGEVLTTTMEAWLEEIKLMKDVLRRFICDGQIIFEYDIPRLGKRIDVVLLHNGIIFCLEFKVRKSKILEADIDQVLDYALDLKNFHKFSQDHIIAPVLVATEYNSYSRIVQMSIYDDGVVNPLISGADGIYNMSELP